MTWNKESIQALLAQNDKAVARAVVAIYNRQTEDEKASAVTVKDNGVGFSGIDARRGTYYAEYVMKTGRLSGRHLELARKMVSKYWRQLAEIANAKEALPPMVAVASASERAAYRAKKDGEDIGNYLEEKMVYDEIAGTW